MTATPDDRTDDRCARFLRRVPLFAQCSEEARRELEPCMRSREVAAGEVVVTEGDPADAFYLVDAGVLRVTTRIAGIDHELASIGPGDWFGEIALLGGLPRTATVTAVAPSRLWSLDGATFGEIVGRQPGLAAAVAEAAKQRVERSEALALEVRQLSLTSLLGDRGEVTIGRDESNALVLPSRQVAKRHATISKVGSGFRLVDHESSAGTFVNGERVQSADLHDGDEMVIGDQRFIFQGEQLAQIGEPRGLRIDAVGLRREVKGGASLLQDISLSVRPGELVAVVGGSGAGKSTLLSALAGVANPTAGDVRYNGVDRRDDDDHLRDVLGYVPQDDIIHLELPLRRTLRLTARLRLPPDTTAEEIDAAVDQALAALDLVGQADLKVGALSGGQRKRCSIGVELLTEPRVFFLDEPTSGLDPATDRQMMRLLRRLADGGSTVVVTTHATKNVALCDKVVVLGRGGYLTYVGPPAQALAYFGVEGFDDVYDQLAPEGAPAEWAERFAATPEAAEQRLLVEAPPSNPGRARKGQPNRLRRAVHQLSVLSARNVQLHLSDKNMVIPLVAQPVLLSLLLLALFKRGLFDAGGANPTAPLQLTYLVAFNSFLLGLLSSVQEIVRERPVLLREQMVGVGAVPYVLSKLVFLAPAVAFGVAVELAILRVAGRLPAAGWSTYGSLTLVLLLTGVAGIALALMTSALVSTSQLATDLLSIWIMPQVLFAGALFAVPAMGLIGRLFSYLAAARWAFEGSGRILELDGLFSKAPSPIGRSLLSQYRNTFEGGQSGPLLVLALFIVVPLALACVIVARRGRSSAR